MWQTLYVVCIIHLRPLLSFCQATPAQLAAERKVAELHGKLHSCESKIRQLTEELKRARYQSPTFVQVGDSCRQVHLLDRVYQRQCNQCPPLPPTDHELQRFSSWILALERC